MLATFRFSFHFLSLFPCKAFCTLVSGTNSVNFPCGGEGGATVYLRARSFGTIPE